MRPSPACDVRTRVDGAAGGEQCVTILGSDYKPSIYVLGVYGDRAGGAFDLSVLTGEWAALLYDEMAASQLHAAAAALTWPSSRLPCQPARLHLL